MNKLKNINYFFRLILEEEDDSKEPKKNNVKVKYNFRFAMRFYKEAIRVFLHITSITPILQNRISPHFLGEFSAPFPPQ